MDEQASAALSEVRPVEGGGGCVLNEIIVMAVLMMSQAQRRFGRMLRTFTEPQETSGDVFLPFLGTGDIGLRREDNPS
jgi:hypothetical protein